MSRRTANVRHGSISCRLHSGNTSSRCSLVLFQYLYAAHLSFISEVLVDAVEHPRVELLVASLSPVRFSDISRPTHRQRANTAFDTLRDDSVRQSVVEVRFTLCEFLTRPHRLL